MGSTGFRVSGLELFRVSGFESMVCVLSSSNTLRTMKNTRLLNVPASTMGVEVRFRLLGSPPSTPQAIGSSGPFRQEKCRVLGQSLESQGDSQHYLRFCVWGLGLLISGGSLDQGLGVLSEILNIFFWVGVGMD